MGKQRKLRLNETVLSGNIGVHGSATDNSFQVVVAGGTDSTASLDGFTFAGGNVNGPANDQKRGGGMFNTNWSNPELMNCTFAENITDDPPLGALADNGGPTRTHALLAGSAAVNAGTSTGAPATDQRGVTRPQGAGVDIGAFEQGGATPVPVPGPSGSGGGCSVGFSPWTLLLLLPPAFLTRR